jgi:hypothetical protein
MFLGRYFVVPDGLPYIAGKYIWKVYCAQL